MHRLSCCCLNSPSHAAYVGQLEVAYDDDLGVNIDGHEVLRGKTVADIGCGGGLLSEVRMFADSCVYPMIDAYARP